MLFCLSAANVDSVTKAQTQVIAGVAQNVEEGKRRRQTRYEVRGNGHTVADDAENHVPGLHRQQQPHTWEP